MSAAELTAVGELLGRDLARLLGDRQTAKDFLEFSRQRRDAGGAEKRTAEGPADPAEAVKKPEQIAARAAVTTP